jgi:signal transduction histidine kinase
LHNLLTNAVAYGNGRVEVSAEQRDGVVVVHVADNGPGIDENELPHIFERFYRARQGNQRRSSGTGLGLAISKAFVEAHGGVIWAESRARGAIISFSLPVAGRHGGTAPTDADRQPERVVQPVIYGSAGGGGAT